MPESPASSRYLPNQIESASSVHRLSENVEWLELKGARSQAVPCNAGEASLISLCSGAHDIMKIKNDQLNRPRQMVALCCRTLQADHAIAILRYHLKTLLRIPDANRIYIKFSTKPLEHNTYRILYFWITNAATAISQN